jgi:hypothetical protein
VAQEKGTHYEPTSKSEAHIKKVDSSSNRTSGASEDEQQATPL